MLLQTCVPALPGTQLPRGSASPPRERRHSQRRTARQSLAGSAVPGRAWDRGVMSLDKWKQCPDFLIARPPAVLANLERLRMADCRCFLLAVPFFEGGAIFLRHRLAAFGEAVAHLAFAFGLLGGILRQQVRGAECAALVELRHQRV